MSTSRSSIPLWVALFGSGLAGALVGVQSRINGGLGQQLDNGYLAAAVSFGGGLLVLSFALLLSRRARTGLAAVRADIRDRRLPVWVLFGGACGAFFVLGQGLVAPLTGLALFTVGVVAGQVLGGLLMDRIGLGPGGRLDPSAQRIVGTVLAIVAVVFSVWADVGSGRAVWLVGLPILAGAGMAWQSAVNGLVRSAARSAITATFVNFLTGTILLTISAVVSVLVNGWPESWPTTPWFYLGGGVGVIFIAVASVLVRTAGVLLLSMSNVAGQLISAVAIEAGLPLASGVTVGLALGAGIALIAVVIAAIPGRSTEG